MCNTGLKLHYYQRELVEKLALTPMLRFNELLIDGLESEHMNYHLKKLVEFDLVAKGKTHYRLTDAGKDYSNLLDDDSKAPEKQPKTSIIIWGVRKNEAGEIEYLVNRRLRQPYYGKVGRLTGKVRFGEALQQAAERELYEETGLTAKFYQLQEIYRKMRKREDGAFVQDVLFYIFFVKDFSGTLIEKTPFQENFWVTKHDVETRSDLDLYDDFEVENYSGRLEPKPLAVRENLGIAEGF